MTNELPHLILLLFGTLHIALSELYYITPSSSRLCPSQPCHTISQFAHLVSTEFLDSNHKMILNITMALLPGNHTLDKNLEAKNTHSFKILSFANQPTAKLTSNTHITCKRRAKFLFDTIDEVHIDGVHIIGCSGNSFKAIAMLTLENCQFRKAISALKLHRVNAKISSSVFFFNVNFTLRPYFNNVVYQLGSLPKGSAIAADSLCNVSIVNSTFEGNKAELGGALYINGSSIDISNSSFVDNHAASLIQWYLHYKGGVIAAVNSTLLFRNVEFQDNGAARDGGVIVGHQSEIISKNCHFNNNTAQRNGGIFKLYLSTLHSTSDHFYSNRALNGGIMSVVNCTVNIAYGHFNNNRISGSGGVIEAEFSNISSRNNHFYNNSALLGGVMHLTSSTIDSIGDSYHHNEALTSGGVMWASSSIIDSSSGKYHNNIADLAGGVVKAEFTHIITNDEHFYNNRANEVGGVWCITDSRANSIGGNFSNNNANVGGGVMNIAHSNTTSFNDHFYNNSALYVGGVIVAYTSRISSRNAHYQNNECEYFGGAIVLDNSTMNSSSDEHYSNFATYGGVMVAYFSMININHSIFESNSALREAGVIQAHHTVINSYVDVFNNNSVLVGDGGVISASHNTKVFSTNDYFLENGAGNDGGVFSAMQSKINCYSDKFINNSAYRDAGAIFTHSSTINSINDYFSGNSANRDGGVLCIHLSRSNFHDDNFINNTAKRDAGVMILNHVTINSTNTYFSANKAGRDGGVVLSQNDTNITFENITAESNTADGEGGVFKMDNGRLEVHQGSFNTSSAKRGGVINANKIVITLSGANTFSDTNADIGSVFYTCGSVLRTTGNVTLLQNMAAKAVAYFMDSTVQMSGNTALSDNVGSLVAILSNVTFIGSVIVTNGKVSESLVRLSRFEGGAITAIQSSIIIDGECQLCVNQARNGGAIRSIKSTISVYSKLLISNNSATESGGGIHLYQSELTCQLHSEIEISGNIASLNGGGLYAISSSVNLKSNIIQRRESQDVQMQFIDNRAILGGGLYLQMNSVIYIRKYAVSTEPYPVINFTSNAADYGGAVFIPDNTKFGVCTEYENSTHSIANECPIQVLSLYGTASINIEKQRASSQNVHFQESTAEIYGSSLYGKLTEKCTINHLAERNITNRNALSEEMQVHETSYLLTISNIRPSEIGTPPAKVCFCKDNTPNCTYQHPPIFTERGGTVVVSLAVLDEADNVLRDAEVYGYLRKNGSGICKHEQDQHTSMNRTCYDFTFRAYSIHASDQLILHTEPDQCYYSPPSQIHLTLQFPWCENCPIGFRRFDDQELGCRCDCHPDIQDFFTNCDSKNQTLQKASSAWISYVNDTTESSGKFIIHPHCPLDYCKPSDSAAVYVNFSEKNGADSQCAYSRSGTLCGSCPHNLSLSLGSSQCLACPNLWPIQTTVIILSTLLSGVILVAIILALNLTVASGTINAIIFYVNIVAANSKILLPFSNPNFATVLISWLNLEFGLDACFFKGMDAYWKMWLQIVFPTYILFLVVMVIILSEQSIKFANLIGKRNPIATLTTLILLSYTRLLHTIIAAFSFTTLKYPDGSRQTVWLPDGTVGYLSGKHIALFVAALLILILGIVYTGLLFSWQWLLHYQHKKIFKWVRNQKLCQFLEPYHAPYKFKYRYWTGLLLLVRVVLYVVSATNVSGDPRVVLVSNLTLVGFLLLLKGSLAIQMYKNSAIDLMETITYFNLMLLSAFSWYSLEGDAYARGAVAYTSVSATIIMFITLLIYHVHTYTGAFEKCKISAYFNKFSNIFKDTQNNVQDKNKYTVEVEDDCIHERVNPTYSIVEIHKPKLQETGQEWQEAPHNKSNVYTITATNTHLPEIQCVESENVPINGHSSNPSSSEYRESNHDTEQISDISCEIQDQINNGPKYNLSNENYVNRDTFMYRQEK